MIASVTMSLKLGIYGTGKTQLRRVTWVCLLCNCSLRYQSCRQWSPRSSTSWKWLVLACPNYSCSSFSWRWRCLSALLWCF